MQKNNIDSVLLQLGNPKAAIGHRSKMLIDIMAGAEKGNEDYTELAKEILDRITTQTVDLAASEKAEHLEAILMQLSTAPMRPATFIQMSSLDGSKVEHALVSMENGERAYVVAHDQPMAKGLKLGQKVMLDATGKMMMQPARDQIHSGIEARFERKMDDLHVEVTNSQDQRTVVLAGPELIRQIDSGELVPGRALIIGERDKIVLCALPQEATGFSHYRFLDQGKVPDVRADRDIGSPSKIIAQVALHVREEMTRPDLRRRYRLRPCITRLLCGVSGTGKTLAIQAIHRLLYEIMSEVTETPIESLPPRVFRMKTSSVLSMWFGESDKRVDRFFDEVEQLAAKTFTNPAGKEFVLPVMVVLEEADGLGRARGQDAIYDRIMSVVLQRLDPNRLGLSDKLVVFLSTTNEPQMVDPAFLRRIGGSVEVFGRLDQQGFTEILAKHVSGLPVVNKDGKLDPKATNGVVKATSRQLFEDSGVVELTYQGHDPVIKHHRDFLTGALIDRAVQQAASEAWGMALARQPDCGLSEGLLVKALHQQVFGVVHQLHPDNVGRYTDIPEGVRVTRVRRLVSDPLSMQV